MGRGDLRSELDEQGIRGSRREGIAVSKLRCLQWLRRPTWDLWGIQGRPLTAFPKSILSPSRVRESERRNARRDHEKPPADRSTDDELCAQNQVCEQEDGSLKTRVALKPVRALAGRS